MFEKLKNYINGTDDDYYESDDAVYEEEPAYQRAAEPAPERREQPRPRPRERYHERPARSNPDNVVSIASAAAATPASKPHICVHVIENYEHDCIEVVGMLRQSRIVILNLENCPDADAQRTIDFFYGITCYTEGRFEKIGNSIYVITPKGVDLTQELTAGGVAETDEFDIY